MTQNTIVQDNCLLIGSPAKVKRKVTEAEALHSLENARHYAEEGKEYAGYFAGKQ